MQQIHLKYSGFKNIYINICKLFCEYQQAASKVDMESKRPKKANTMLKKKVNKVGGLTLADFETYHKAPEIKTVRHWQKQSKTKKSRTDK